MHSKVRNSVQPHTLNYSVNEVTAIAFFLIKKQIPVFKISVKYKENLLLEILLIAFLSNKSNKISSYFIYKNIYSRQKKIMVNNNTATYLMKKFRRC